MGFIAERMLERQDDIAGDDSKTRGGGVGESGGVCRENGSDLTR